MTIVDVQINPASTPWPVYAECSRRAEELGFGALWVYDHLAGSTLRGETMLEAIALLGGLSTMTSTIGIGAMVLNAGLRRPSVLAASLASLQTISGGRLLVGLGAGAAPGTRWSGELDAARIPIGATMRERHDHVVETIDMCRRMWAGSLEFSGFPQPDPAPPMLVGVNSEALTRIAVSHADGINVLLTNPRHRHFVDVAREASSGNAVITVTAWAPSWDLSATALSLAAARALAPERIVLAMIGPGSVGAVERLAELALS